MLRNKTQLNRSLQLLGAVSCVFALTSCNIADKIGAPFPNEGWATAPLPADYCADQTANKVKKQGDAYVAEPNDKLACASGPGCFNRCVFPSRDAEGNIFPDGREVNVAALNQGREAYMHYCYACHGVDGDGKGPASHGLRPPPRDFRAHSYKFAAVKEGLPNDWDFMRIIKGGLHGSAMLEWDIPEAQLVQIVDFIKTFPPAPCDPGTEPVEGTFKDKKEFEKAKSTFDAKVEECASLKAQYPGAVPNLWHERFAKDKALYATGKKMKIKLAKATGVPIYVPEADPWVGKVDEALTVGKALYHAKAQCVSCHPSYVTTADFGKLLGDPSAQPRADFYFSTPILPDKNAYGVVIMPPDFTMNPVRSIRTRERVNGEWVQLDQVRELWRLIASGIGGTGMPSWKGSITDDEIWALAHYVKSLVDLRQPENKAKRLELHNSFENQPKVPPKPAEPEKKEEPAPAEPAGSAEPDASAAPSASAAPKASAKAKDAPKAAPKSSAAPKAPAAPKGEPKP